MKMGSNLTKLVLLSTLAVLSCTKKVPYKYENKDQVHNKSAIDTKSDYIYVASTANSSRTSDVARPYWQGEEKLVKLQFTENTLQVIELDRETRFSNNTTNNKLVLEIPVEHIQYKCAEDNFGECTNSESQDKDLNWQQRSAFKPNFGDLKITEKSMLPIELENLFTGNCYEEASSKFLGYEIKDDKINFEVERVFNANIDCLTKLDRLSDLTFSQVYHYSFAKLNRIASADFKPITYPTTDENTFGFFTTNFTKLDVDNNASEKDQVVLMNHWNPKRKVIDYYLSEEFNKKENLEIKNATQLSVDRINEGLTAAGVDLQIKLHDNDGTQIPGDITKSMIVLVEDPSAASVLGYGPTVANPLTGEILSGHVIMYKGILESYLKYAYDDIRLSKLEERKNAAKNAGPVQPIVAKAGVFLITKEQSKEVQAAKKLAAKTTIKKSVPSKNNSSSLLSKNLNSIEKTIKNYTKNVGISQKDYLYKASKHCLYSPESLSVDGKVSASVAAIMGDDLKKWEDLSSADKKRVLEVLLPATWVPTLVHELGHNLGLRHNFSGSEDKSNFYTPEELATQGVDHEIPYSSVMEYGSSELDTLTHMGKYDIAALKYGYNREVVASGGAVLKIETTLADLEAELAKTSPEVELTKYMFCTDEHVGANAGCKRFDAGTTYTEIAQQLISDYESKYSARNFRNQRISFSLMGDIGYAQRIDYTFDNLRTFFEVRERIKHMYDLADDDAAWEQYAFLKDLNNAVNLSAEFFMNVIKTPDASCAVASTANLSQIVGVLPISQVSKTAANCSEIQLNPAYKVVGTFGKSFQSRKSDLSNNPYVDQIDVRGIWIDKVLATRYLFARKLGSYNFDKNTDNYTDIAGLDEKIVNMSRDLVLNQLTTSVTIRDMDGLPMISGELPVDTFKSNTILEPIHSGIARAMGVPNRDSLLTETYLQTLSDEMQSTMSSKNSGRAIADLFRVHRANIIDADNGSGLKDALTVQIGQTRVIATPENGLAGLLISQGQIANILASVSDEKLDAILTAREANQPAPADMSALSEGEKFLWTADMDLINGHLGLKLTPENFVELLQALPGY